MPLLRVDFDLWKLGYVTIWLRVGYGARNFTFGCAWVRVYGLFGLHSYGLPYLAYSCSCRCWLIPFAAGAGYSGGAVSGDVGCWLIPTYVLRSPFGCLHILRWFPLIYSVYCWLDRSSWFVYFAYLHPLRLRE